MRRLIGIPLAFACGAFASVVLVRHAPHRFSVDVAQPLAVATNWNAYGAWNVALLALTLLAAAIAYVAVLRAPEPPSLRASLAIAGVSLATLWWYVPLFSSDLYAYAAYGEMSRLRIDPYHRALLPHANALIDAARWQWSGAIPLCVYGAGFVAIARLLVTLVAPLGIVAQLDAFRILSACALLLAGALLAHVGGDARRGRVAAAALLLNPVALWSANEGHNDTILIAIVLAGIVLIRRAPLVGAMLAALGALVKAPAFVAASALACDGLIMHVPTRRRLVLGAAIGATIAAAASRAWFDGVGGGVLPHGVYAPLASAHALPVAFAHLVIADTPVANAVGVVLAATWVLALVAAASKRLRARDRDGWMLLAFALWIAIPNPYPWYTLWLLPLVAFIRDPRLVTALIALSFVSLARYVPDAVGTPTTLGNLGLSIVAALPPLAVLCYNQRP